MKKIIYLLPAILLFACAEESVSEDIPGGVLQVGDQEFVDSLAGGTELEQNYESIEDYITIHTKSELYELFSADNLKDDQSWYGEGSMKYNVTWLTNPLDGNKVKYVWDEENSEEVIFVEFFYSLYNDDFEVTGTQEILSTTGIYTGMSFEELKAWNEESFDFRGFGWDFEGGIMPGQGSKIEQNPYGMKLEMTYSEDTYEKYTHLFGDVTWNSDVPETDGAPIVLGLITYWGPSED